MIFDKKRYLVSGTWYLGKACDPLPDWVWDWVWDWDWDWVWVALGWPKRGPRVAQAPRKGRPRVDWRKCLCLQQKSQKGGVGAEEIAKKSPELPKIGN